MDETTENTTIENTSIEDLRWHCVRMRELESKKEELELQLRDVNVALDDERLRKIPELMQSLQLKNAKFEGLGRVQLASDLYASTRAGMKEAAIQWLMDCGYGGMVQPTVNSSSLKALFRRLIVSGAEIPEEIFNVTPYTRASIVKT